MGTGSDEMRLLLSNVQAWALKELTAFSDDVLKEWPQLSFHASVMVIEEKII